MIDPRQMMDNQSLINRVADGNTIAWMLDQDREQLEEESEEEDDCY